MSGYVLAVVALSFLVSLFVLLNKWDALPGVWQVGLAVAFIIVSGIGCALALYYVIVPWAVEWAATAWSEK